MPDSSAQTETSPDPQPATARLGPVINIPPAVLILVFILIAVHAALQVLGEQWNAWALYAMSFIPRRLGGEPMIPALFGSQVWTFLTYAFLHGSWVHLLSNCLWLTIFATPVFRKIGTLRALTLLAVASIAGAAAMLPLHWGELLFVMGASAAVSGAMAAAIPVMFSRGFSRQSSDLAHLRALSVKELAVNRGAIAFAVIFLALSAFTGASQALTGTAFLEETTIAWEAHLGGFAAGLVAFYLLDRSSISQAANDVVG